MSAPAPKLNKAQATRQYIAAGGYYAGPRRLPDIAGDAIAGLCINHQTYQQIACDPEASAALLLLVIFVLADGIQFAPAVSAPPDGKTDPQYDRAVAIKDHIERTVSGLERTLAESLEMLIRPAMTYGNKVAEKVYVIPTDGPDAYKLVLKSIKVLKRGATSFIVDEYDNLLGLAPTNAANAAGLTSAIIPLEKFIVASFRMEDEDPRGTSIFGPVVKPWHIKQLAWPEFLAYLMRWAVPSIIAILSENAGEEVLYEADGVTPKLVDGQVATLTPQQVVLAALEQFKNSSIAVFEHGTSITPIEAKGEGEVFANGFDVLNSQIRKGILLQELATADAQHQTKSAGESQMNVVELLVWSIKQWVCEALVRRQIVYPQVLWNFGESDANEFCPLVSAGDYERKSWDKDATAVVALVTATTIDDAGHTVPVLTYSQIQDLLTQIGIKPPTEEEVKAMRAAAEKRAQQPPEQQQQPNQPPANDQQPPQRNAA